MAKRSEAPKTLGDKVADVIDHVLHPEAKAPEAKKEKKGEASDMPRHKKFDKFKKQET